MKLIASLKAFLLASAFVMILVLGLQSSTTALPPAPSAVDAGATYTAKCAKCHGPDGKGVEKYKKQGVKDFTDAKWQKSRTDAQFTASITNGKGDVMPAFKGKISPDEIKALVAHVRAFKH